MAYMATLPDKAFDLAIVDPPFFKGVANGSFYGTGLSGSGRKRGVYKKINNWDSNIPDQNYYNELCRVSVHQIIWGINYFQFKNLPTGRIVWDKRNDDSTFSNCEIASCSLITSVKIFRYQWNGFLQEPGFIKEERHHPTQKPVQLYKWLLTNYPKISDRILDTHLGSGSSAIAAANMGFEFVGCELDIDYYNTAVKRFKEQTAQTNMFR